MKIEILTDRYYEGCVSHEAGRFKKWMRIHHPEIEVTIPDDASKYDLHDYSIIMPLVSLASDMSLQNYLAVVVEYVKAATSNKLEGETDEIQMSVIYHDNEKGIKKEFNFKGSQETLNAAVKKFDLNKFME
ncbi:MULTISPECIES: hypothetical protein [Pseudomonas]|uniref:hypothetical protein n=1 Tax=Pseudomonas TaxID=286 RepID=UPI001C3D55C9|nr:hypothetical protein [Pseudomonas azerbaijanorientalis]QXH64351.1 hypothetical protein KSS91_13105 [Pseudomonas azerbaijanorientalis]